MRKFLILSVLIAAIVFAHAPSEMEATFNTETKLLEITIEHPVKGDGHYIDEIHIELNGEEIIVQKIKVQEDSEKQTAIYKITDAKAGDEIEIIADCNKFGKKKLKIVVG